MRRDLCGLRRENGEAKRLAKTWRPSALKADVCASNIQWRTLAAQWLSSAARFAAIAPPASRCFALPSVLLRPLAANEAVAAASGCYQ